MEAFTPVGFVELRVHGVSGSPPASVLGDPNPKLIAGDDASGFWRRSSEPGDGITREAYAWGGLTSGSPMRATWVLLAPFALVNAANAMHKTRDRTARAITRLFALSLTVTLVGATYIVSTDLLAWQCGSDPVCVRRNWYTKFLAWDWLAEPGRRLAVSLLLPVAVVALLWWLARSTWQKAEQYVPEATVMPLVAQTPFDHPDLWDGRARGRLLRHLHVAAAIATIAAQLSYAFMQTTDGGELPFALALVTLAAVALLVLPNVPAHVSRLRVRASFAALATAWAALAVIAGYGWTEPEMANGSPPQLPGVEGIVTYLFVAQVIAVALLLVTSRWPAAAVSFVALGLGAAFSAGVIVWGADFLGEPDTRALVLPEAIAWAARGTAIVIGVAAAIVVGAGIVVGLRKLFNRPVRDARDRMTRAAARLDGIPKYVAMVMAVLVPIVVGGAGLVVAIDQGWATELQLDTSGAAWRGLTVAGSRAIALFAVGLVAVARMSYNNATTRRRVGIVWDIATFWPRHAHPLAPPCYAERAVPELGSRIAELTNGDPRSTDPRDHTSPVVVSAHSQGSVIAVAALLRQGQAVGRVALVTYGSPLDRLYRRYFPAFFPLNTTTVLADRLEHRWINLYRVTDPIGGPVAATGECDWEVPLRDPLEGHGGYTREPYYRDALTIVQQWLSGRLSA